MCIANRRSGATDHCLRSLRSDRWPGSGGAARSRSSTRRPLLVSRTPERLERYAELGASTRFGDFLQPESLETAYEGGDRMLLISLNSSNPDPRVPAQRVELQQTAIDAAVEAGVEHIVYTSIVDADNSVSPIAVWHRATEADLRESGVTWTALRNQWYADGLVTQAARMVEDRRVVVLPDDPGTAFVTREDCAVAAAVALMTPGHENRVYEITGPNARRRLDRQRDQWHRNRGDRGGARGRGSGTSAFWNHPLNSLQGHHWRAWHHSPRLVGGEPRCASGGPWG